MGGPTWLPIYFFTLIAGYKYGCKVGILTAVLSPVVNHLLFGMPAAAMLPAILVKSSLLAVGAAFMAHHTRRISLAALAGVILFYQVAGGLFEWMFCGDFYVAIQDFRIGIPGLLVQWIGGYLLLRCIAKY